MCGIIGYAGTRQAAPILLDALKKLEYRGYDSAGVAVMDGGRITVRKARGRLTQLAEMTDDGKRVQGVVGIGHTRWATHGEPSDNNSHPHLSNDGQFVVVHNGIIENYRALKEMLEGNGFVFHSQTDTEVISNLLEHYNTGDLAQTLRSVVQHLQGSYALGVLSSAQPDQMVAARKDSPLIVGIGQGENYIVSDIPAILNLTRDVYLMQDGEIALLDKDTITFFDALDQPVEKEILHVDWEVAAAEKGGYEHFMMKEIMEQPKAVLETFRPRIKDGRFTLDGIQFEPDYLQNLAMVHLVACGSAYHAGRLGKDMVEQMLGIPAVADIASEFRYRKPILKPNHLVIIISQSGETADTIAALREAKARNAKTMAIVNVVGSTIAREADYSLYTWAGPEIAVATTKGYTTQVAALVLLCAYLAQERGQSNAAELANLQEQMLALPAVMEAVLQDHSDAQHIASLYFNHKDAYFIGRGTDYCLSMEGCLKLKEISYIHSEAQPAGELKHGTISLITPGCLVIALITNPALREKTISNIQEVKARGASVLAVCLQDDADIAPVADHQLRVPWVKKELQPMLAILPLQLLAYYISALNGNDVDKPRNLAKSVTVE